MEYIFLYIAEIALFLCGVMALVAAGITISERNGHNKKIKIDNKKQTDYYQYEKLDKQWIADYNKALKEL